MTTRMTAAARAERGRAARSAVPRSSHGPYEPARDRPDPIGILAAQAATRVPELVPIRYGRMLSSPFAFYRGAAAIMASDLAGTPRSGLDAQMCGDAHLSNFGVFGSPERRLIFDVNDFDETLPGPWEWDLKRLVASVAVAGRERGSSRRDRERGMLETAGSYRALMAQLAAARNIDVWYARVDVETLGQTAAREVDARTRKRAGKLVAKARTRDSMDALAKLTRIVDGHPRIVSRPPLIVPLDDLDEEKRSQAIATLRGVMREYRSSLPDNRDALLDSYELADFARKVVGVGSVGTEAWIALLLGRDDGDPLFLQIKEAQPSVHEAFLGSSEYRHAGERVVEGQRLMQPASDIMLGWIRTPGLDGVTRDFYIRQLWDSKGSALIDAMEPNVLTFYAKLCGSALATAHARSGDAIPIASYLGTSDTFDEAMATFAETYAEQNERDYDTLKQAVESGRVTAEPDL